MSEKHEVKRVEPPLAGDEAEAVLGALDRLRATFEWKCSGLDPAGMNQTVGASTMTLGGLVKHVASVEAIHFSRVFNESPGAPWDTADSDWSWRSAVDDTPEQLLVMWRQAVGQARDIVAKALAQGGMDGLIAYRNAAGESPNLRRTILDMVEEYGRHVGHADLIRESVDGLVGEDPPA